MYDYIIVGAGYAGAVCARRIAEELDKQVLVIDKREHIAGNMYDFYNEDGILVHKYGPHISVMNEEHVFAFLSRFTQWVPYHHTVRAEIDGISVPLPFNLTAVDLLFDVRKAVHLKELLIQTYGFGANIPILEMRRSKSEEIRYLAEYIYEKIFVHYTMKMWGLSPEEIDPSVTARIPVRVSYDNRHFLHKYQVMPKDGFTHLINRMLDEKHITVRLGVNAKDMLQLDEASKKVRVNGQQFCGRIIYTGPLDELFDYRFGALPYRSLEFAFETHAKDYVQECSVLNWPDDRPATRRTEMKRLSGQQIDGKTTTIIEYPGAYDKDAQKFNEPYYPIVNESCATVYEKYRKELEIYRQIIPVGRLADYKYYNMEAVIIRALDTARQLIREGSKT